MAREVINEPTTAPPFSRLPGLLQRLYDGLVEFLDAKLALFRKELWEEGKTILSRAVGVGIAAMVVCIGFLVLTAALVMALNELLNNFALSALIVGAVYIVGGIIVAISQLKSMQRPLSKTQAELEKDKQWIRANT